MSTTDTERSDGFPKQENTTTNHGNETVSLGEEVKGRGGKNDPQVQKSGGIY